MQLCLRVLRGVFGAAWLSPEEAWEGKSLCLFSYFWNGLFTGARVKECLVGLTWDLLEMLAYPIIQYTIYLSDYTSSSFWKWSWKNSSLTCSFAWCGCRRRWAVSPTWPCLPSCILCLGSWGEVRAWLPIRDTCHVTWVTWVEDFYGKLSPIMWIMGT